MKNPRREMGIPIVISGPSGVGKDTVKKLVAQKMNVQKFVTCTTRKPRPGEKDGIDYHFLSRDSFLSTWNQGKLLDFTEITGNLYGLPLKNLEEELSSGKDVILDLVPRAAMLLKKMDPRTITIFIGPPSPSKIVERLRKRGMGESEIHERLKTEPATLTSACFFDFIVINYDNEADEAAERIVSFVLEERKKAQELSLHQKIIYSRLAHMYPEFFATQNEGKLTEANQILSKPLQQISVDLYEPQGVSVADIVKEKAQDAFKQTGKFVVVEDTSLEILSWNGLPGALIKWFIETVGNKGLLEMLGNSKDRKALAKTAVAYFDGNDTHVFVGEIEGSISLEERGENGFGWDSIFIPAGENKTFAEMSPQEKNSVSMRKLAFEQMKLALR